jgi:tetratricopeptide (TPR) repeat protein
LATAYFQQKHFSDAAKFFEEAAALDPENYELWGNLGDAYYWAPGMRDRAAAAYRKALTLGEEQRKVNPRNANLLSYLAGYQAMLGEARAANETITEALRLMPRDPEVLYYAGLVHVQFGEREKAIDALQRSVAAGYSASAIRDTPNFAILENDPRYRALTSTEESKAGRGGQ